MERIPLTNSAFEGANNAYLFADGPETVLVDTGDSGGSTRQQLEASLADHGVGFADIDRIFLTHWHHDHSGLADVLQAESGAPVHVHTADAPLVEGDESARAELHDMQAQLFEHWGMPADRRNALLERLPAVTEQGGTPSVTTFEDGDVFSFNGRDMQVVHASGHAAGLCLFELDGDDRQEALTGDALLPVYTPNVGGADVRVDDALAKYLDALRGIVEADYARAWPGHRDPIDTPTARAEYIINHHEERAWRVLDAVDRLGPCNTWTVSAELFGDLDGIHILHGPGEAHAHLEHLVARGSVVSEGPHYRLAEGVASEIAARADKSWPLEA